MTHAFVQLELLDEGRIARVQIVRPEALNALNAQVLSELKDVFEHVSGLESVRAVILTGTDRAFIAGADIKAMEEMSPEEALAFGELGHATTHAIASCPAPVIAALNGFALGGGLEVAISCDLIYASDKARVGLPEVGLGLIPGFGGTQRLQRLIGVQAARELTFTGRHVKGQEIADLGIALAIVPHAELAEHVLGVARAIAERGPVAVRTAKRVLEAGRDVSLAEGLRGELGAFQDLFAHDEAHEGMLAFIQKRTPSWS